MLRLHSVGMTFVSSRQEHEARKGFPGRVANALGVSPGARGAAFHVRDGDTGYACSQPLCSLESLPRRQRRKERG